MTTETLPAVAPFEPTTPIKPSEAIRLGCLIAPVQAFGEPGDGEAACAIAALDLGGFRGEIPDAVYDLDCPGGCVEPAGVMHLHDDHRWSRERIADWLEGLGL